MTGQLLRASCGVGRRFAAGAAGSSDSAETEGARNRIFWVLIVALLYCYMLILCHAYTVLL
jgi:hypothetical protein